MITHGRGLLCMPILPETAARLQLGPMVDRNTAPHQTPYTVPVDHISCRTGISAEERARTVRAIIDPATQPDDLVRPGHLFPLVAKEGGVLPPRRAYRGHRGSGPAGRLDSRRASCARSLDGTRMASREKLHEIAREHDLPIVSIEALDQVPPPAREAGPPGRRGGPADPLRQRPDHRLSRAARAGQRAGRDRHGRSALGRSSRWCGCTPRASPVTCSIRCGATAATSSTWPWR